MQKVPILLSQDLIDAIKQKTERSNGEFPTVNDYIEYVLRQVLEQDTEKKGVYSEEDESLLTEKLKKLGYE